MTYYADLTKYEYFPSSVPALNVGWLERPHEFPTGRVSKSKVKKLLAYYDYPVNQTRGFHTRTICRGKDRRSSEFLSGIVGSAEIWVLANDGQVFACPKLIAHYIVDHSYLPPPEFLEAVRNGPRPHTEPYQEILASVNCE